MCKQEKYLGVGALAGDQGHDDGNEHLARLPQWQEGGQERGDLHTSAQNCQNIGSSRGESVTAEQVGITEGHCHRGCQIADVCTLALC